MISSPTHKKKSSLMGLLEQIEHSVFLSYGNLINRFHAQYAKNISAQDLAKSCMLFSPHFDDETLGCGGMILKKGECGAEVRVVFMTDGRQSHHQWMEPEKLSALRTAEGYSALKKLGIKRDKVFTLGFPETGLSNHTEQAFERVKELLFQFKPDQIFLPYTREPLMWSSDHIVTTKLLLKAIRECPWPITTVEYPIWAWFHFPWIHIRQKNLRQIFLNSISYVLGISLAVDLNTKIDVEGVLDLKRTALEQHRSQMFALIPGIKWPEGVSWPTLGGVAEGDFLKLFFRKYEYFRISHNMNTGIKNFLLPLTILFLELQA